MVINVLISHYNLICRLIRQAAAEIAIEEMVSSSTTSSSSPSSAESTRSVVEKGGQIDEDVVQEPRQRPPKPQRRQWDTTNVDKDFKQVVEKPLRPKRVVTKPFSVECFMITRGWELDQSQLLRSLDRIKGASFSRIQVASTINRVVENVRPNLDAVILHIGTQELRDAIHSSENRDCLHSVASSVATVTCRQIIKVAHENRNCIFFISLPLTVYFGKPGSQDQVAKFAEIRKAFNAATLANCSSHDNIYCINNDNIQVRINVTKG